LGPWPFSRQAIAKANQLITQGRPRSIGYTIPFSHTESTLTLDILRTLHRTHRKDLGKQGAMVINEAQRLLDTDNALARSFKKAGNVVLAMPYKASQGSDYEPLVRSESLARFSLQVAPNDGGMIETLQTFARKWISESDNESVSVLTPPLDKLSSAAAAVGLGLDSSAANRPRTINSFPLAIPFREHFLPSFSLLVAAQTMKLKPEEIVVESGKGIQLGDKFLNTDANLHIYPMFYQAEDDAPPFETISFVDLLDEKIPAWKLQYRTVLVGLTAPSLTETFSTPVGESMPSVLVTAQIVASLLNGDVYRKPLWSVWVRVLAFILVAAYLMLLLPRLRLTTGFVLTGFFILLLSNVQFVSFLTQSIWLPMMVPIVTLLVASILLAGKRVLLDIFQNYRVELSESNLLLAQAFQSQGQFIKAFTRYRKCIVSDDVLEHLYYLGLDFEGKRQFIRASEVYRYIQTHKPAYRDTAERIERNNRRINALAFNTRAAGGFDRTLIVGDEGVQKPKLGRYRIDKEIGQGEMGIVYLGQDTKIGRRVAIKTMVLSKEFDEEQLPEIKKRFLREAEAAGRLNHPNIVTIYDVGEEQDLAYITMDLLTGTAMSAYTKPDTLLPIPAIFKVIVQVAAALDCAHKQGVVHRDIKSANIIYDRDTGLATVTDFGVASLTDVSKTKTGMILGTPAFMSPEHLAGEQVDGRSDIFSLGVTLYQLLTGKLPFEANSLSSLMYKITNDKHLDVCKIRPQLPRCTRQIVDLCLKKQPDKRLQKASLVASSLRRCAKIIIASKVANSKRVSEAKLVD
jgi:CHASE2 domain-containing sensor protein/tRNA A-37 threonylcarbamoyl transferase component Bud32